MPNRGRPRLNRTPEEIEILRQQRNERQRQKRRESAQNENRPIRSVGRPRTHRTSEEEQIIRNQRIEQQRERRLNYAPEDQEMIRKQIRDQVGESRANARNNRIDRLRNIINDRQITDCTENYLGKMNVECIHCKARHFEGEKVNRGNSFNDCCNHGKVILEKDKEFPPLLKSFFLRRNETV